MPAMRLLVVKSVAQKAGDEPVRGKRAPASSREPPGGWNSPREGAGSDQRLEQVVIVLVAAQAEQRIPRQSPRRDGLAARWARA